jgi:hypothetical protein
MKDYYTMDLADAQTVKEEKTKNSEELPGRVGTGAR